LLKIILLLYFANSETNLMFETIGKI